MQPRKCYIDSRWRANPESSSHSDFVWQFPQCLSIPEDHVAIVSEFSCSNVFYNLATGVNDKLYLEEVNELSQSIWKRVPLVQGWYNAVDLATMLQTRLNAVSHHQPGAYAVSYDANLGRFKISNANISWRIWTREMLETYLVNWGGTGADAQLDPTQDCCDVLGNTAGFPGNALAGEVLVMSQFPDLVLYKCLYLLSEDLGNGDSLGCRGESSIIRRIDVSSGWGTQIVSQLTSGLEYVECGGKTFSSFRFRLTGSDGKTVDTRGRSISFSLHFVPRHLIA